MDTKPDIKLDKKLMGRFPRYARYAIPAAVVLLGWLGWTLFGGNALLVEKGLVEGNFEHWQQANPDSTVSVNHVPLDELLSRYTSIGEDGINRFQYKSVTPEDRVRLRDYIAGLEKVVVTGLAAEAQLAYWINLYNALTVQVILDHYPVESIRDISFAVLESGPWGEKLAVVEGMALSLDDIEHSIVRPIFDDNRVHYALNCASIGCPNLRTNAYTRDNLEASLEAAAREYINHPRGVSFEDGELIVSSLFDWYEEDFGENQQQILEHFRQYAQPDLRLQLEEVDEIDDFFYDWSLNDG